MKGRNYILYVKGPRAGELGFPGKWTPDPDFTEQIPGLSVESETENKEQTMSELKPISFEALASKEHEDKIGCVEGRLSTLYDAKTGTTKAGKDWSLQDGVLKDASGNEHRVCFAAGQDVGRLKGRMIRLTSHVGEKGMSGLYMKEDTYTNKQGKEVTTRKIHVTATANIEEVGSSGQPAPSSAKPQSTEHKPMESQTSNSDPAEVRIANYFSVFNRVCLAAGKDPDEVVHGLSSSDIKEITTGICMSFKGQYGAYLPPHFADREGAEETMKRHEAAVGKSQQATQEDEAGEKDSPKKTSPSEKPASWRECVHPKKKVALGDLEEEDLMTLIDWAHTAEPKSEDGIALRSQILVADAELRYDYSKKVSSAMTKKGLGGKFEEEDVDEVCNTKWGSDFSELNTAQLYELLSGIGDHVKEMVGLREAKNEKPKKKLPPKPAASDDDDDDEFPS